MLTAGSFVANTSMHLLVGSPVRYKNVLRALRMSSDMWPSPSAPRLRRNASASSTNRRTLKVSRIQIMARNNTRTVHSAARTPCGLCSPSQTRDEAPSSRRSRAGQRHLRQAWRTRDRSGNQPQPVASNLLRKTASKKRLARAGRSVQHEVSHLRPVMSAVCIEVRTCTGGLVQWQP